MLKQLDFIVLVLQEGKAQAVKLGDLSFATERISLLALLSGAKNPTFSEIKGLNGSQLKEMMPLDQSGFRKGDLDHRLPQDASCCNSHMTVLTLTLLFHVFQNSPNDLWIKSVGSCSSSAKHLLFLLQEK